MLPAASPVHYTTSCKHSLMLLRMGEIIARNNVELIEIINKLLLLHLVGCLYYCISDARWHKYQMYMSHLKIPSLLSIRRFNFI